MAATLLFYVNGVLSVLSFLLFVYLALRRPSTPGAGVAVQQAGLGDMAKLAEALAKLADALHKAGPAITAALCAIFFMMVCAVAAGLDKIPAH